MDLKNELFKSMYLVRYSEEKISGDYFNDEMKTPVHLSIGAEAISAGTITACNHKVKNIVFGTYRNHAQYLIKTGDVTGFFGELFGRITGVSRGKAGSMHLMNPEKGMFLTSAVVGTTIPPACGAALANKLKGNDELVVVFFGDGSVEEGAFYESLNFASLHNLKILFVCEDNELAIHSTPEKRRGFKSFKDLVSPFNINYRENNGVDAEAVYHETSLILKEMEANNSPGFLHFKYFRFLEHVGPQEDFKFNYRAKPENHSELDPINFLRKKMSEDQKEKAELDRVELQSLVDKVVEEVRDSAFPKTEETYQYVR